MWHLCCAAAFCALPLASSLAQAVDVTVMISGGFLSSYEVLVPGFEAASHDHVVTVPGPSMGATSNAIPQRLARGEADAGRALIDYGPAATPVLAQMGLEKVKP